jgi:hypothetical protein
MKKSLPNPLESRRRLVINPWLEEHTAVPVRFEAIAQPGLKCVRKWENPFPTRRERSGYGGWAGGKL